MPLNVDRALRNLRKRRTDPETGQLNLTESLAKSIRSASVDADKIRAYLDSIFEPIESAYLAKTFNECERIQNQIEKEAMKGNLLLEFEHQGSATNGTSIRVASDIDLLVIYGHFFTLDAGLPNPTPYHGNPLQELIDLRNLCARRLTSSFPEAKVDTSGAKSITITGGSLARKVDVVPASWHNSTQYAQNNSRIFRGIKILDSKKPELIENYPFMHNALLGLKDQLTGGRFTALVRAVKSLKEDALDAGIMTDGISSYSLTAVAYHMDDSQYKEATSNIGLLLNFVGHVLTILQSDTRMSSMLVPNGKSNVFDADGKAEAGLRNLMYSVFELLKIAINGV